MRTSTQSYSEVKKRYATAKLIMYFLRFARFEKIKVMKTVSFPLVSCCKYLSGLSLFGVPWP